jgi:hypothetical protein
MTEAPVAGLNRRVQIATSQTEARAVVEDDYHHFRVTVRHAKGKVLDAFSQALRFPTAICPAAGGRLSELNGMALASSSAAALGHTDARQQCTHMIDLAGLAIAAAARGVKRRHYFAQVPDRREGRTTATLVRDGREVLQWDMDATTVVGPQAYAGVNIGSGFTAWASSLADLDLAEAALVLRRAIFISGGRGVNLDLPGLRTGPMGGCWTWQPERAANAHRMVGSTLDFTGRDALLTATDEAWLAFEA